MANFISKENLFLWLKSVIVEKTIIAPVKVQEIILFAPVSQVENITLDYEFTVLSPKNWLFPPSEVIFTFEDERIKIPSLEKDTMVFGLHPCDALAIHLLDFPFLSPPPDTWYKEKREKTTIVGLGCIQARPECFCTSAGTSPLDPTYMDVLLIPVIDGFIVEVKTEKGGKSLSGAKIEEVPLSLPAPPSLKRLFL